MVMARSMLSQKSIAFGYLLQQARALPLSVALLGKRYDVTLREEGAFMDPALKRELALYFATIELDDEIAGLDSGPISCQAGHDIHHPGLFAESILILNAQLKFVVSGVRIKVGTDGIQPEHWDGSFSTKRRRSDPERLKEPRNSFLTL